MRELFLGLQRKVRFSDLKESTQERSSLLFLNSVTLPVMAGITAVIGDMRKAGLRTILTH